MVALDVAAGIAARRKQYTFRKKIDSDFSVLVPIYGNIKYLENVKYLSQYGRKVYLCTTGGESKAFMKKIEKIAKDNKFNLFVASWSEKQNVNVRATSGTIRDRLIRDALAKVKTEYVVTLDADSTTTETFDLAVSELRHEEGDLASVRLVPKTQKGLFNKLQKFEYHLAMDLRLLAPWLVSGACQVAKTKTLRDVMNSHSMFFQGNDVEIGLLAQSKGYKVVHTPFEVYTTVPATWKAWLRQRLAWSGGEFRLYVVNIKYALKHPLFWLYGAIITIALFPLRWVSLSDPSYALLSFAGIYLAAILILHGHHKNFWVLLMPFYTLFQALILIPAGVLYYFYMALKDRNFGIISAKRAISQ